MAIINACIFYLKWFKNILQEEIVHRVYMKYFSIIAVRRRYPALLFCTF
ncbi:hypothetical protein KIS4809_4488 [Bacillus sp. ZZV12-4809]|nr:hypothetical protein KIS4809_4488 [Bacillus sp. ZZV12-4809]